MAVSKHTRKGKVRRHTNGTFGAHVNGKRIDLKLDLALRSKMGLALWSKK